MTNIQSNYIARRDKIKNIVMDNLANYYSDLSRWEKCNDSVVKYSIFYSDACAQWLEIILLYGNVNVEYAKKHLIRQYDLPFNVQDLDGIGLNHLKKYYFDRAAIHLILKGEINQEEIGSEIDAFGAYLGSYGIATEVSAITEIGDNEVMLSVLTPQIIAKMLLKMDCSTIVEQLEPAIKSKEKIWRQTWRLIYKLYKNDLKGIENDFYSLLTTWKVCFVNSKYHSFRYTYIVFIYYLCSLKLGKQFNVLDISKLLDQ